MKYILLIVWAFIIMSQPFIKDYITLTQLEFAYVVCMLWYFTQILNKNKLNYVFCVISSYYGWIFISDQFIDYMFYELAIIETISFAILAMICVQDD